MALENFRTTDYKSILRIFTHSQRKFLDLSLHNLNHSKGQPLTLNFSAEILAIFEHHRLIRKEHYSPGYDTGSSLGAKCLLRFAAYHRRHHIFWTRGILHQNPVISSFTKFRTIHRSDPLRVQETWGAMSRTPAPCAYRRVSSSVQEATYLACQRPGAGLLGVEVDDPTVNIRVKLSFCQKHTDITMGSSNIPSFWKQKEQSQNKLEFE